MTTIKFKRRLLATVVVGIALVTGAALLVSMDGDDKPSTTANPPPVDEEPQDAQANPTTDTETAQASSDEDQDDSDDPEVPDDDENGPGDDDQDDPEDEEKGHGLQTAIQAHVETMEKTEMKGKSVPAGLHNSLQLLTEMYAGVVAGEETAGVANGHNG